MGTFFAYTLYSGVFLLLLYLLYKLFLSREKQINLNRAVLLVCYVVAFAAWPLSHIEWHSAPPVEIPMSGQELDFGLLSVNTMAVELTQPSVWPKVTLWIYLFGAVVVLLKTMFSVMKLFFYIRKGACIHENGYSLIVMPGSDTAPFSFGQCIVMSEADYATVCETVAAHELAHIRCRHYLDLLLAQTVCILLWYNPTSWLMRDELKLIHEYQADAEVLDGGVDERDYQMLLIRKTVGNRFHTLANNLNHSKLKNRIAMMQKEKVNGIRRLRIALLAIAPVAAIGLVNIPAVASRLQSLETASLEIKNDAQTPDGDQTVKAAEFVGGSAKLMEYLAMNLRFPESARAENRQGCTVVGFTVAADGRLSDIRVLESGGTDLDNEAIRVVDKMPNWSPSSVVGNPVASEFALPIRFRLMDIEDGQSITHREVANGNVNWLDEVQVVAYGVKPAAEPSKPVKGKRHKTVAVETDSSVAAPLPSKKTKLYPTAAVGSWKSPKTPVYGYGVPTDKEKKNGLKAGEIESEAVDRPSDENTEEGIDIKLKNPHAYIDLSGSKVSLVVGPCGEKDCDQSSYEAVRVDGKMLKESRAIDMDAIESFDKVAPCQEYPNGLLDIKLKKSTPKKKATAKSKRTPRTKQMSKRTSKTKNTLKREPKQKRSVALKNSTERKKLAARQKREIKRVQALKKQQAKAKQKALKKHEAQKRREAQKKQEIVMI